MSIIRLKNVSKFYYSKGIIASGISRVNLDLDVGEFVVITGESGSGKSTLLNVISGLDTYEEGEMYIEGKETSHYTATDFEGYRKKYISSIFQSFNLISSYTVYQNVALALEIDGVPGHEIREKVPAIIEKVGLSEYKNRKVSRLSGGQKQRVAIAGIVAMRPDVIILDEATAMLDPRGRKEVIAAVRELNEKEGMTVILITHYMDEAVNADKVFVLNDGVVAMSGTPAEIFDRGEELSRMKLCVPLAVELAQKLRERGVPLRKGILDTEGLTEELKRLSGR